MKTKADVAIIGCGEAGIFAGYELKKLHPELEIVVVEQGKDIFVNQPIPFKEKVRLWRAR